MLLYQFSTSHYCRKARLALGYKEIPYRVENLTPGIHRLKLKPLTGLSIVPVLCPERPEFPQAIADSSQIFDFLEAYQPEPPLYPALETEQIKVKGLEDWLDESIGTATRFVYYQYRAGAGKAIDPSLMSQVVIQVVRRQYGINPASVALAEQRLQLVFEVLSPWKHSPFLLGEQLSVADITAAALLSPLALLPDYRQQVPWLFERIREVHQCCHEPLPPGLT